MRLPPYLFSHAAPRLHFKVLLLSVYFEEFSLTGSPCLLLCKSGTAKLQIMGGHTRVGGAFGAVFLLNYSPGRKCDPFRVGRFVFQERHGGRRYYSARLWHWCSLINNDTRLSLCFRTAEVARFFQLDNYLLKCFEFRTG